MEQKSDNVVCWRELRDDFNQNLRSLGYSERKLNDYSWVLNKIERFIFNHNLTSYSSETGDKILSVTKGQYHNVSQRLIRTVVYRLNDYSSGKFEISHSRVNKTQCPEQFAGTLHKYLERLRKLGRSESTIKQSVHYCTQLLNHLGSEGVTSLSDVTAVNIHGAFIDTKSNKSCWSTFYRGFLKYLHKSGIHGTDLSVAVPTARRPQPLPSTYSKPEIEKLLAVIDRSTRLGQRNYAIVLLAIRFGMRSSDIANLKLTDVNFLTKTVNFVQEKTSIPQRFELLPEIEDALHCYLANARPEHDDPSMFLRNVAPFTGIGSTAISTLVGVYSRRRE